MMTEDNELETHLSAVALPYRELWLEAEHVNGQIACVLADALGWQPTDTQPLADALELAEVAAARLREQEDALRHYRPKLRARQTLQRELA